MDYADYGEWLTRSYPVVKQANPNATVMIAGLVNPFDGAAVGTRPDETVFLDKMLEDYNDYFDILDLHVYGEESDVTELLRYAKERMSRFSANKPIWISETSTNVGGKDPEQSLETSAEDVVKRYGGSKRRA